MVTKVSTKGQVVLPVPIRRKLGIRAGDPLDASVEDGRIVLTPQNKPRFKAKIIKDPATGFPMISLGPKAPILTHDEVRKMLADFP
jgi:AbrB family looped-hinge helix DNA binding protein